MFSLEISDIKQWIRTTYPDTGWTDMQIVVAAYGTQCWIEHRSPCNEYCQGQPCYWERDPYRRAYVCSVCGRADRDVTDHAYGCENAPTRISGWDGEWERIRERASRYAA